jgi:hypothetical protein
MKALQQALFHAQVLHESRAPGFQAVQAAKRLLALPESVLTNADRTADRMKAKLAGALAECAVLDDMRRVAEARHRPFRYTRRRRRAHERVRKLETRLRELAERKTVRDQQAAARDLLCWPEPRRSGDG